MSDPDVSDTSIRGLFRIGGSSLPPIPMHRTSGFKFNPDIIILKKNRIPFSVFKQKHAELAASAANALIQSPKEKFKQRANLLSQITNSDFYNYVLMVACVNRKDTRDTQLPPAFELMPDNFFPVLKLLGDQANSFVVTRSIKLTLNETGTDLDPEHKVAYFREDLGLNSHHWHWHVVYPGDVTGEVRDRKGELFYYMHRQMLARYDAERLSVGLKRVKPLDDWDERIPEGYNSRLINQGNGFPYSARVPGLVMVGGGKDTPTMDQMKAYKYRILGAIQQGYFIKSDGSQTEGIDIDTLGAVVEASSLSPDKDYYGSIHNYGHNILSQICDPDGRFNNKDPGGVMGSLETACRDPVFFRWHKFVDALFEAYQQTRAPYTDAEMSWPSIKVKSIGLLDNQSKAITNINTKIDMREAAIQYNLDLTDRFHELTDSYPKVKDILDKFTKINVSMPHLDHDLFYYEISVENKTSANVTGNIRIFLAPKSVDESSLTMEQYRRLCINLDQFTHVIEPGTGTITRCAGASNVTISWDQIVGSVNQNVDFNNAYCGCGWPENLLVPRGNEDGMPYTLLVVITNWAEDQAQASTCKIGGAYCGVMNDKYPDKRAMGFPFDRPTTATDLDGFISGKSNMAVNNNITITYTGETEAVKENEPDEA